jgi:hypothetical protein
MAIQEDGNTSMSYKEGTNVKYACIPSAMKASGCEKYGYENLKYLYLKDRRH